MFQKSSPEGWWHFLSEKMEEKEKKTEGRKKLLASSSADTTTEDNDKSIDTFQVPIAMAQHSLINIFSPVCLD